MKTEIVRSADHEDNLECVNNNNVDKMSKTLSVVNCNNKGSVFVMDCGGCGENVDEQTVLCVGGRSWHSKCLRCFICARSLHDHHSCFLRNMRLYCRHDYVLNFGTKCAKCGRNMGAGDWVRRARDRVYHLACFACDACSRQLSTGEHFALLDARLLCKTHYLDVIEGNNSSSSEDCDSEHGGKYSKSKRVRTTFTEEQLAILQANFQLDSNPDGQDLERIANVTGLTKRVTQVWFQNSRARQKKHNGKIKSPIYHSSPLQHHTSDIYQNAINVDQNHGSPKSFMNLSTPVTPSTPGYLQIEYDYQSG
ncbi:LIM/homeobox protein Awh-like [Leptopilina heterotoma]|uniref:LIM/homeobox protein Awh-like n=1 Tax=Leptopilina heterotoma TaxID=63436 RepID=UPI001CA83D85|nr:LIM/homeobox protein Awh-like [Leptopilina heterotoma]